MRPTVNWPELPTVTLVDVPVLLSRKVTMPAIGWAGVPWVRVPCTSQRAGAAPPTTTPPLLTADLAALATPLALAVALAGAAAWLLLAADEHPVSAPPAAVAARMARPAVSLRIFVLLRAVGRSLRRLD